MKYKVLLKFLQSLIYLKRFFWWSGSKAGFALGKMIGAAAKFFVYLRIKLFFFLKRKGAIQGGQWYLKREILQALFFLMLFLTTLSQTDVVAKKDLTYSGQKTLAYSLIGSDEEIQTEEIYAEEIRSGGESSYSWKTGTVVSEIVETPGVVARSDQWGTVVAGGTALIKPILMPGVSPSGSRTEVVDYTVQPGDSLSAIAYDFSVSVPTILWENGLSERSIIRPGDVLKVPPTTGVMHSVKTGDTIKKIASLYGATVEEIVKFNRLKEDGSDLKKGEKIMVPGGKKQGTSGTTATLARNTTVIRVAAPPNSRSTPSIAGFVWPTAARIITQYFGIRHHALDIAGPWKTPIYAAKAGVVETSQCGWNSGYGCYIIINHGDGLITLYGHNSQLLVAKGDYVETGQTIALMGNTGKVRGVTGIHTHFEIKINGSRVNPLKYIR